MSNRVAPLRDEGSDDGAHLDDLPDGCGCAEVWEHLSEARSRGADD